MNKEVKLSNITWIKLGIIVLMILCVLPMPYGFYNLVRFASMIGFAILAYSAYNDRSKPLAITYGCLALMFQPFIKLVLGREVWNLVDIGVAIFLIIVIVKNRELKTS